MVYVYWRRSRTDRGILRTIGPGSQIRGATVRPRDRQRAIPTTGEEQPPIFRGMLFVGESQEITSQDRGIRPLCYRHWR